MYIGDRRQQKIILKLPTDFYEVATYFRCMAMISDLTISVHGLIGCMAATPLKIRELSDGTGQEVLEVVGNKFKIYFTI